MDDLKVSVIVPTYNGLNKIKALLPFLEQQTYPFYELIIVIDGSKDGTLEYLESYQTKLLLKYIFQENKGRAAVRNRGAKEATGDLLIFNDDDTKPSSNWLKEHIGHHQKFQNSVCIGQRIDELSPQSKDFQKFKYSLVQRWNAQLGKIQPLPKENILIDAANFSISKSLFDHLGGFKEKLNDAEDLDLGIRCYLANIPIYYNERAKAIHADYVTCKSYIKRQLDYKKFIYLLFELGGAPYEDFKNIRKIKLTFLKVVLYSLFKRSIFSKMVDKEYFKFLPKSIRYKLYEIILTAPLI